MKGTGSVSTKWFEAEKNSSGTYEMTDKGKSEFEVAKQAAMGAGGTTGSSGGSSGSSGGGC